MLRDRGIPVHAWDAVVHRLMAANGAAVQPVIDRFGDSVLASDGSIDRWYFVALSSKMRQTAVSLNQLFIHWYR